MTTMTKAGTTCPLCHIGELYGDTAEKLVTYAPGYQRRDRELPRRLVTVEVVACNTCEFIEEVRR